MAKKGALKSVYIVNDDELRVNGGRWQLQSGPAIRVRGFREANLGDRRIIGGDALPVYILGENDIRANGGQFLLKGGQPISVTSAIGSARGVIQGKAIPIWPVDDDGNYDSGFIGINAYRDKVLALNPSIYYMMSEDVGAAVALDSSGNGFDGAYTNVVLGQPGIGDGRTGADYNGGNSRCLSADISGVFNGAEYSLVSWIQVDDWTQDFSTIIRWFTDGNNNASLSVFSTDGWLANNYEAAGAGDNAIGNAGSPAGSIWLHVAGTVSAAADLMLLYINAVVQADTGTTLGVYAGVETQVEFGGRAGGVLALNGRMQHAAVFFGTILTQAQITDLATVP